jgi:hypothetical protein
MTGASITAAARPVALTAADRGKVRGLVAEGD